MMKIFMDSFGPAQRCNWYVMNGHWDNQGSKAPLGDSNGPRKVEKHC